MAGTILLLYFWMFFSGTGSLTERQIIGDPAAIVAGVTFVFAALSYFWSPRQHLFPFSLAAYTLLVAMMCLLLMSTGGVESPFVALWVLAAVFAPVFGWWGVGLITACSLGYLGWLTFQNPVELVLIGMTILISFVPIVIGCLAWTRLPRSTNAAAKPAPAASSATLATQSDNVIHAIADGVIATDGTGKITLINPSAQQLLGWIESDAIGLNYKSVLKLIDNRNQPVAESADPVRQTLEHHQPVTATDYSIATNDTEKTFSAHISVSPVGESQAGAIIVFRDTTKELADEREQTEFISTASHEMRTPVASIEGYLGLALNPATAQIDDKARDYIGKAHDSAQHLGRLFQDLLDVTKADDGRLSNNPKITDVVAFVARVVEAQLPSARQKDLSVDYKPMPTLDTTAKPVNADRTLSPILYAVVDNDHLREVIGNLVENAIKYTPNGSVVVDVTGDANWVTVSVTDSGIGIPQEDIPHLFQKFYRVDNTDTREIGGTGLGLYLCRKLVESMGGKIWVESVYRQGSTFFVSIPRTDDLEAQRLLALHADTSLTPSAPPPAVIEQPAPAATASTTTRVEPPPALRRRITVTERPTQ